MRFKLALVLPLLAVGGPSAIDVSVRGDRVSVHSTVAPLSDVLSRFAQVTGAELVYEASRPRQLVSVGIDAGSQAEALARLLEGQGINYALRLAANGRDVQLLVVGGATGAAPPAAAAAFSRARPPQPEMAESDQGPPEAEEAEPAPEEAEPEPAPAAAPVAEAPGPGAFVPQGPVQTSPTPPQGNTMSSPVPFQGQPQFPQPGSYPGPGPGFPRPVSYP